MQDQNEPIKDAVVPTGLFNREVREVRSTFLTTAKTLGIGESWTFRYDKPEALEYALRLVAEVEARHRIYLVTNSSAPSNKNVRGRKGQFTLTVARVRSVNSKDSEPAVASELLEDPQQIFEDTERSKRAREIKKGDRELSRGETLGDLSLHVRSNAQLSKQENQKLSVTICTNLENELSNLLKRDLQQILTSIIPKHYLSSISRFVDRIDLNWSVNQKNLTINLASSDPKHRAALETFLLGEARDGDRLNHIERLLMSELSLQYSSKYQLPNAELDVAGYRKERAREIFKKMHKHIYAGETEFVIEVYGVREKFNIAALVRYFKETPGAEGELVYHYTDKQFPLNIKIDAKRFTRADLTLMPKWLRNEKN